jgi:hypothetical protein
MLVLLDVYTNILSYFDYARAGGVQVFYSLVEPHDYPQIFSSNLTTLVLYESEATFFYQSDTLKINRVYFALSMPLFSFEGART